MMQVLSVAILERMPLEQLFSEAPQYVNSTRHFVGTIAAVDIEKGEILWKVPHGGYPVLADSLGITNTGSENYGNIVVTAGGLLFVAGTVDGKFRAYDKRTGDLLWEHQMKAPGYSSPSVYQIEGKQYVVIVAGGRVAKSEPSHFGRHRQKSPFIYTTRLMPRR